MLAVLVFPSEHKPMSQTFDSMLMLPLVYRCVTSQHNKIHNYYSAKGCSQEDLAYI